MLLTPAVLNSVADAVDAADICNWCSTIPNQQTLNSLVGEETATAVPSVL